MNTQTLKALKASIAHWKRLATGKRDKHESIGISHCSLCNEFWNKECYGCPVSFKTGRRQCEGSPFGLAELAFNQGGLDYYRFKKAAAKELAFLQSLLPKRKKK